MRYPTIEELFDTFEIDSDDYNSHDEMLVALNEEVASWAEDKFDAHGDDVLEIIEDYGVSQTVHAFENDSVCKGIHPSIEKFWDDYVLDFNAELEEAIQIVIRSGFLYPEVDVIAVEQDFTIYPNGTVIQTNWG